MDFVKRFLKAGFYLVKSFTLFVVSPFIAVVSKANKNPYAKVVATFGIALRLLFVLSFFIVLPSTLWFITMGWFLHSVLGYGLTAVLNASAYVSGHPAPAHNGPGPIY